MADDPDIEELLPEDAEEDEAELLQLVDAGYDEEDLEGDVEVTETEPAPVGRTWSFDFNAGRFVMQGRSPQTLRGDAALKAWIEKALHSVKGASVVHHPDYGMEMPLSDYLSADPEETFELEADIQTALTFHPAITGVEDIEIAVVDSEDGDATVEISFRALTGEGDGIPVETGVDLEGGYRWQT